MRFRQFLNEAFTQANVSAEDIFNDCQYYFKMVRLSGNPMKDWMWHGTKAIPSARHDVYVADAKRDREPRDTPRQIHDAVNAHFMQRYGKPFRSGVFATGYYSDATIYARDHSAFALIPIGTFSWLCSADTSGEMRDLTGTWRRIYEETHERLSKENPRLNAYAIDDLAIPEAIEELMTLMYESEWYFNESLMSCIHSENEIMIDCSKFYLVDRHSEVFKQLYELAGGHQ